MAWPNAHFTVTLDALNARRITLIRLCLQLGCCFTVPDLLRAGWVDTSLPRDLGILERAGLISSDRDKTGSSRGKKLTYCVTRHAPLVLRELADILDSDSQHNVELS